MWWTGAPRHLPGAEGTHAGARAGLDSRTVKIPSALRIDAELPPSGPARWATIAGMAFGGLVAILVVVYFAVLVAEGWLSG